MKKTKTSEAVKYLSLVSIGYIAILYPNSLFAKGFVLTVIVGLIYLTYQSIMTLFDNTFN